MSSAKITSFFKKSTGTKKPGRLEGAATNKRIGNDENVPTEIVKRSKVDRVEDLLSSLESASWKSALAKSFASKSFGRLADFVAKERSSHTVYPPVQDTWTALNACSLEDIKVVIVGQDPYHGPNQAHGLCFSVLPRERPPPSLKNIYKELSQDPDISFSAPDHGYLLRWAKQGVLMLNTVMTVRKGEANSHKKKGWEDVTDAIIRAVDQREGNGCVFLLWGKPAAAKALQVIGSGAVSRHTVIVTSHPSPLGATKTKSPFLGSRCFSQCNEALTAMGQTPIDWSLNRN